MELHIRSEQVADFEAIDLVNDLAFGQPDEGRLVRRLRRDPAYVPELALVAEVAEKVVAYLMFTRSMIVAGEKQHGTLTLAPLAVLPAFQRQEIGKRLVAAGLRRAVARDFRTVHVLGHPDYYARFGFVQADALGIFCPFEVPPAAFRVMELVPGALAGVSGTVQYATAFYD